MKNKLVRCLSTLSLVPLLCGCGDPMQKRFHEYQVKAEEGSAEAQYELATRYQMGLGVSIDRTEMMKWFRKAAEQNHARSQFAMALNWENREGNNDYIESYAWAKLAGRTLSEAANYCGHFEEKIFTQQELAAAKNRAEELRAEIAVKLKSKSKEQEVRSGTGGTNESLRKKKWKLKELEDWAQGKTKEQVKEAFGPPNQSSGDTWLYNGMQVLNPDTEKYETRVQLRLLGTIASKTVWSLHTAP